MFKKALLMGVALSTIVGFSNLAVAQNPYNRPMTNAETQMKPGVFKYGQDNVQVNESVIENVPTQLQVYQGESTTMAEPVSMMSSEPVAGVTAEQVDNMATTPSPMLRGAMMETGHVDKGSLQRGQTWREILGYVYQYNPQIEAARAELRSVDETVPQALSGWRPTVGASAQFGVEDTDPETRSGENASVDLTVSQPLYRGGRTVANTKGAEKQVLAQRAILRQTEQEILQQALVSYMDVLRDRQVVDLNSNNEKVLARQLEATRERFNLGELTLTDVAQAEARLSAATANKVDAIGQLRTSVAVYENVVGSVPEGLIKPKALPQIPSSLDDVLIEAEKYNPNVLFAEYTGMSTKHLTRSAKGALLPSVTLGASAGHTFKSTIGVEEQDDYSLTVSADIPIYTAGADYARIRQAKHVENQKRIEIQQSRREARQDGIAAWESFLSADSEIVARRTQVKAAELALEGVEQENLAGSRTVLDVLDAEQELLDAKVNLVRTERDRAIAVFDVLSSMGRLTVQDLNLDVEKYRPEKHYDAVRDQWFGADIDDE